MYTCCFKCSASKWNGSKCHSVVICALTFSNVQDYLPTMFNLFQVFPFLNDYSVLNTCHFWIMLLIWLSFSIILSCVSCQLSLSCNENKGIVPKKLAVSILAFIQTVLSLKTEFNSTNRCLAVSSNPFKPHWCPTSTRCCWTFKDTGLVGKHVGKCILQLVMKNYH